MAGEYAAAMRLYDAATAHVSCRFSHRMSLWRVNRYEFITDVPVEISWKSSAGEETAEGYVSLNCCLDEDFCYFIDSVSIEKLDRPLIRLDEYLVPIMSYEDLEDATRTMWEQYLPEVFTDHEWLNPYRLAERMGLKVTFHLLYRRKKNRGLLFWKDGTVKVVTHTDRNDLIEEVKIEAGTIVINDDGEDISKSRLAVYHECFDDEFHWLFFRLQEMHNDDLKTIQRVKKARNQGKEPRNPLKMLEWEAREGARMLMLPTEIIQPLILSHRQELKWTKHMARCVCRDGRVHGLLQFYGANRTGRWCLTGDHEVLTDKGWLRLDEWHGGRIACWNASSEAVSFQKAEQVSFDYAGPMYTYRGPRIDQCSTPDHRMRVQSRYGDPWTDMTVKEMSLRRPCIPFAGYRYHRGCANPSWLRVLIMTQADGHYTADGAIRFHFVKQRKIERCKMLLRKAEIPFVVRQHKERALTMEIPARAVPLWLREFRSKTFGFWLLDENPDIFFDELPHWDGYYSAPNSIQYSTVNKQNADIVQALAHMSGRSCIMKSRKKEGANVNYVLDIWLSPGTCHELKGKPVVEEFVGKIYCAVASTGYFLVRRNGKVWVTGNSGRLVQAQNLPQNHLPDLDLARDIVKIGDEELLDTLFASVPGTLSELIRTAFIPKDGCRFLVADFSAIEARVLAWLAGEEWVLEEFRGKGKIYEATASRMFHIPHESIVKGILSAQAQRSKTRTKPSRKAGNKDEGARDRGTTEGRRKAK